MLTLEKAKLNLRIDEDDEYYDEIITDMIEASKADIQESTGVPPTFLTLIKNEEDRTSIDSLYTRCQNISVSDTFYERDTLNKALNSCMLKLELAYGRVEKV